MSCCPLELRTSKRWLFISQRYSHFYSLYSVRGSAEHGNRKVRVRFGRGTRKKQALRVRVLWRRWFRTLESSQWAQCPTLDSPLSFPHTHQPYYTRRCTCLWSFMVADGTSFISPRLSSLGTEDIWAEFCSLLSTTYWIHYQGPSCLIALYLFLPL